MRGKAFVLGCLVLVLACWLGGARAQVKDAASQEEPSLRPGANCEVFLRGDASGAMFNDRVPALGNLISRKGSFVRSDGSWLVLRDGTKTLYIPRASILLVEETR